MRARTVSRALLGALAASSAMGCSIAAQGSDPADAEALGAQAALVTVERVVGDATRTDVVVRAVRSRGAPLDEAGLRLAGLADDLPAAGACATSQPRDARPPTGRVELVDLGAVSLEVGDLRVPLAARNVPDPAGVLSGLVYSARIASDGRSAVVVRATGAAGDGDAPSFSASGAPPREVGDVHLGGAEPRELDPTGGEVDLTWAAGDPEDIVAVDVRSGRSATRCAFADTGRALVPAALFADEGTLTIHRVHRERFRLARGGTGELRLDTSRTIPFARRRPL